MPILLPLALAVIFRFWPLIVVLISHCLYESLLTKYHDHWLVLFGQVIDLTPLDKGCADFHLGRGRGSAVNHPVPRLVRALLVKYLFDLSYRETEEKIDRDLLVKWFVGYGLFDGPPDHTTLQRFEIWVLAHRPRLFFDEILRQIDALHPEDRRRIQLVDSYAMLARGAKTSIITLLRDACGKLLAEWGELDPERWAALLAQLDQAALFGQKGEKPTGLLKPDERDARLQLVVAEALRLQRLLTGLLDAPPFLHPDDQAPLRLWLGYLTKIIADETTVTRSDPANPDAVLVQERPHGQKGTYRIVCANDPVVTYRDHGKDTPAEPGFNASLLSTRVFIRDTYVATGCQPDPVALPILLESQYNQHSFYPDQVGGDQAYGTGKTRAAVEALTHGQTRLIARLPDYEKRSDRFPPAAFNLAPDGASLTCPNDVTTFRRFFNKEHDGSNFRFTAKMCQGCSLLQKCRGKDTPPANHRDVFISRYRDQVMAALAYNRTDQFKRDIKERAQVERIIYNVTHIHGGRRAHSTGLDKANFQTRMTATAFNIRQLLRLHSHQAAA
jgi:transposase